MWAAEALVVLVYLHKQAGGYLKSWWLFQALEMKLGIVCRSFMLVAAEVKLLPAALQAACRRKG